MRTHTLASVLATSALALALLTGCSDDPEPTASDPEPTETSSSTPTEATSEREPSDSATPSESPSSTPDRTTVPVYFVGDTPQGLRLFREFRRVGADNPLEQAAALLTAGDVLDPDYRTLFPAGGEIASITHDAARDQIIVQVVDDAWADRPSGMSRAEARITVQSLVHTLQGVVQERAALRVVSQRGSSVPLFGIPTDEGVTNAPPLDVLALVNVTNPEQGATVSGSFTASGVASSFEATVPWEIRQDGEVVERGFSTAEGWMDKLYPWATEVDVSGLEPGDYEFVAMTDDPSGGEGPGPTEDSKTITVE